MSIHSCFKTVLTLTLLAFGAQALAATSADQTAEKSIRDAVNANLPRVTVNAVAATALAGIYRVELSTGESIHMSADGQYILTGDLLQLGSSGVRNLSEEIRGERRVRVLAELEDKDMVVFPAEGEEKGSVFVFTDPTCGYCVRFHGEVPELNKRGVTVKYLAWPRAGISSAPANTLINVWCHKSSEDRMTAMDRAKNNQSVAQPDGDCDPSNQLVQKQIQLGQELGVRGTPALYLKDGRQVGGYLPPDRLLEEMGI